jgi:hypothetical protein
MQRKLIPLQILTKTIQNSTVLVIVNFVVKKDLRRKTFISCHMIERTHLPHFEKGRGS